MRSPPCTAGRRTQLFHLIFTEPGSRGFAGPCGYAEGKNARRDYLTNLRCPRARVGALEREVIPVGRSPRPSPTAATQYRTMDARRSMDRITHTVCHTQPHLHTTIDRERAALRASDGSSSDAVAASTDLEIRAAAAATNDMYHQKVRLADRQSEPPFLRSESRCRTLLRGQRESSDQETRPTRRPWGACWFSPWRARARGGLLAPGRALEAPARP